LGPGRKKKEKTKSVHVRIFDEEVENFLKAFGLTMGLLALGMALLFVPPTLLGGILAITVGPYIAGYYGGKHTRDWHWLGILSGLIWASGEVIIIITLADTLSIQGTVTIGKVEGLIIIGLYIFNVMFCTIGSYIGLHSALKDKRREVTGSRLHKKGKAKRDRA